MLYSAYMKYEQLIKHIEGIIDKNIPLISNLSNVAAILYKMNDVSWAGFYLFDGDKLYLGPFQGDIACTVIPLNKGVCGASASKKETIIVHDVTTFKGHIACSSSSKSEIVTPIYIGDKLYSVIDIDSDRLNSFNEDDQMFLEKVSNILLDLFK